MPRKYLLHLPFLLSLLVCMMACQEEEYAIPQAGTMLRNDVIKRTLGPNLVGLDLAFAYAMALPASKGKLVSAQVEASIAGAPGTYLENNSYHTNGSGADVGVKIGEPSTRDGKTTTVTFTTDTSAATLRYFYAIPEEARGKTVTFTFSAKSSNGEAVSYAMGPYTIARMDMKRDLAVKDGGACYISIADLAVYTAAEAAARADKIDLVYLYRTAPASFAHALVAPAAEAQYLPGVTLPAGVNRTAKVSKAWNLRDQQLAPSLQYAVFIDDLDFQKLDISNAPNYALNLKAEAGTWVETADGKYKAFIFVNRVDNTNKSAQISIKRYAL